MTEQIKALGPLHLPEMFFHMDLEIEEESEKVATHA
jgi:hypothetical protein